MIPRGAQASVHHLTMHTNAGWLGELVSWLAGLAGWAGWLGWLAELAGWPNWLRGLADRMGWLAGLAGWVGWLARKNAYKWSPGEFRGAGLMYKCIQMPPMRVYTT